MREKIISISESFKKELEKIKITKNMELLRVKYLGKNGELTKILKQMGKLSKEERPIIGKIANQIRDEMNNQIKEFEEKKANEELLRKINNEAIDITIPSKQHKLGSYHPINITTNNLVNIFRNMGFSIKQGPQIETVYNNFDALNTSDDHPSRSRSDTFYIDKDNILRTHTSTVQIRTMLKEKPPIKMISFGRCFRYDEIDATHSPMFNQLEGLVIDKNINMSHLKGTMELFVKNMFGEDSKLIFRPHNFPFTEPSAEVDISCFKCQSKGCRLCSNTGYIEILGCGMVHPNVLEECGINSEEYTGFAFGMGIDRIAMLRYEIDDIRYLYDNDIRFLKQFRR